MDYLNTYTSTGVKLFHHRDVIDDFEKLGILHPITLQVAPTSICNLKCSFCSNTNRQKDENLNIDSLIMLIQGMRAIGLKSVEISGGGDPTLYPEINELLGSIFWLKLKAGFITNGILLKEKIYPKFLDQLSWVRISMNSLDYVKSVDIPKIRGTLGFSYVMNDKTNPDILERLDSHVDRHSPSYVRIVPNCQSTEEEQIKNNESLSSTVRNWGKPYFYQAKNFEKPKSCYWCYIKPFVLHDGYVYPCSSVVLNSDAGKYFHEKYRWCSLRELPMKYFDKAVPFDPVDCDHCVFTPQNNLLYGIINHNGMEDFV